MSNDSLEQLLQRRVKRDPSSVVSPEVVEKWTSLFGLEWADCARGAVPSLMFTTFVRPSEPPTAESPTPTGVVLHDELKLALGLPVAIATGYELDLREGLQFGDQMVSEERIFELGPERTTRFGPGREWVIEVASTTTAGVPVGVERFQMLGYRPGDAGEPPIRTARATESWLWTENFDTSVEWIRSVAAANHVWAPAHHDRDAAQAAGLPDIILDTSSQVAVMAGAAQRRRPNDRIVSVALSMKQPILPGVRVTLRGRNEEALSTIAAVVDDREVSRATITFGD